MNFVSRLHVSAQFDVGRSAFDVCSAWCRPTDVPNHKLAIFNQCPLDLEGEMIDLTGTISFLPSAGASPAGIGAPADSSSADHHHSKDILGRVHEYFASAVASD